MGHAPVSVSNKRQSRFFDTQNRHGRKAMPVLVCGQLPRTMQVRVWPSTVQVRVAVPRPA